MMLNVGGTRAKSVPAKLQAMAPPAAE